MNPGRLEVAPERFADWLAGFVAQHPGAAVARDGPVTTVQWDRGLARCVAFPHDPLGLMLIRRGGYAVGLAEGGRLVGRKVGRRHVQSRTAAGGWSQQRFARRRAGQADALVEAVAEHAGRVLVTEPHGIPAGMVVGGDRTLVAAVLAEPPVGRLTSLPRRELPDLPDPDGAVLTHALWRGRAVWVELTGTGVGAP
jgi:hypothetical protein